MLGKTPIFSVIYTTNAKMNFYIANSIYNYSSTSSLQFSQLSNISNVSNKLAYKY